MRPNQINIYIGENLKVCHLLLPRKCIRNLLGLIVFISFIKIANSEVNSSPCPGVDKSKWFDCVAVDIDSRGNKYSGYWREEKPNGRGVYTFASGSKYIGDFIDGKFHGQGTLTFSSGAIYKGEFKSGKFNGNGTYTFINGDRYVGEYKDGESNGKGIRIFATGAPSMEGIWKNGNFFSQEKLASISKEMNSANEKKLPDGDINLPIANNKSESSNSQRLNVDARQEFKKQTAFEEQKRIEAQHAEMRHRELENQSKISQNQSQSAVVNPFPMTVFANRKALVIGNDTYKSVAKLANAREDARTIALNLTAVGYQVTLKLDLTEKEMKATLRTFASQVEGGDEVLFFFAGHGVQLGATNYLLPVDIGGESEAQVRDEAIQLQRILDDMTDKKAKFTLAMIDACRDNPFKTTGRAIGGRGLAPTTAATGQMVVFSAGNGQQAMDKLGPSDKNKNGVFTRVFVKEMQKSGLTVDRIVKNVRNEVAELAKSVGHEQVPAIYDQVLGDFYFKK